MALRFFKIFIWYGFIIQFQQVSCFRYSWFRSSKKDEVNEFFKRFNLSSGSLQRDKRIVIQTNDINEFGKSLFKIQGEVQNSKTPSTHKKRNTKRSKSLDDISAIFTFTRILKPKSKVKKRCDKKSNILEGCEPAQVPDNIIDYKKRNVGIKKSRTKRGVKLHRSFFNFEENQNLKNKEEYGRKVDLLENLQAIGIPQVPDDDIEDDGRDQSTENDGNTGLVLNFHRSHR
ncbi:hypothetical protein ILUMI_16609 [Ignelater luminosus]|uniref:Uncharacterized protein n=1 Tax=Ignelater luminosus TaxID=2038154 RepID=A0A8K0CN93_IGNLU|nr:hypothetical protein ILUMI_16609 [Ignelater luminosus]